MTNEEFNAKEDEILSRLPIELRAIVSYMAYERGHVWGMVEVLGHVESMVYDLEPAINKLMDRIRNENV
jgi:hypothetical protein